MEHPSGDPDPLPGPIFGSSGAQLPEDRFDGRDGVAHRENRPHEGLREIPRHAGSVPASDSQLVSRRGSLSYNPGMDVLTAQQMREADRHTIEEAGIPARVLMENAGRAVADIIAAQPAAAGRRILILCGRGGNGGDGLVALRALAARGLRATAVLLADPERLTGETRANYDTAMQLALHVVPCPDEAAWEWALRQAGPEGLAGPRPGVIVDAILGTGSSGPLRDLVARVVADLDHVGRFRDALRVSVDIPTGLTADTGNAPDLCFRADLTIALAAPKVCHFVFPASAACGEIRVVEIGIPRVWLNAGMAGVRTNDERRVAPFFPARQPGVHKGQLGRLLLVAGSRRMPGAAALAAQGALSAGVGLLTVAGPADGLTELPPEAMRLPLPSTGSGEISLDGIPEISAFAADAIALGPGLGNREETKEAARRIVQTTSAPLVLDADGLNAWTGRPTGLAERPRLALTPHPGEAARLLSLTSEEVQLERLQTARRLARETGAAVALKGPGTLIADPRGTVFVNRSGGPELAAGGSGDVLTGVVGALLARGLAPLEALSAGVFLHGRAGTAARDRRGEDAVTASEVAAHLGNAIHRLRAEMSG